MAQANIRAVITAEDRASGVLKGFGSKVESLGDKISHSLSRAKKAFEVAAVAATGFAIKSAADLEKTNTSFQILIGNVEQANKLFGEIKQFADQTPFQFPELASATRLLLGYGVSADKAFKLLKQLGDAAGATGGDINGITLAFSQMIGRGKVTGDNLRQLTENFVNLRPEMARIAGVELKDFDSAMQDGALSSEILIQALEEATSKGGRFFQGTDKLAKTFSGRMSTLKDTIAELGRNLIGVRVDPALGFVVQEGGVFDRLSKAVLWLNQNLPRLRDVFIAFIRDVWDKIGTNVMKLVEAIRDHLIPALSNFWHGYIEPLIPVLGTVFWGAINALLEVLTFLAKNIETLGPIMAGFGTLLLGSKVLGAINSITIAIATQGGLIPALQNLAAYISGGALINPWTLIAAAGVAAGVAIYNAWRQADDAVKALKKTLETNKQQSADTKAKLQGYLLSNDPELRNRAQAQLNKQFSGKQMGGPVSSGQPYMVGERRPEMFVPREAGRIVPQPRMGGGNQTINLNVNVGMYAGSEMEKRKIAESLMRAWQDLQQSRGMA